MLLLTQGDASADLGKVLCLSGAIASSDVKEARIATSRICCSSRNAVLRPTNDTARLHRLWTNADSEQPCAAESIDARHD